MKQKILGLIAAIIFRLLRLTYRFEIVFTYQQDKELFYYYLKSKKPDIDTNFIMAFFHQDELCLLPYFINKKLALLISLSKDGEIMANATKYMGHIPVRGSSSRGAVAGLLACIKKVKEGYSTAIAVDGPRGPIYVVKEGVIALSEKTSKMIIPIRAYPKKAFTFEKAWNKARLAYPFSTIKIVVGKIGYYQKEDLEIKLKNL